MAEQALKTKESLAHVGPDFFTWKMGVKVTNFIKDRPNLWLVCIINLEPWRSNDNAAQAPWPSP